MILSGLRIVELASANKKFEATCDFDQSNQDIVVILNSLNMIRDGALSKKSCEHILQLFSLDKMGDASTKSIDKLSRYLLTKGSSLVQYESKNLTLLNQDLIQLLMMNLVAIFNFEKSNVGILSSSSAFVSKFKSALRDSIESGLIMIDKVIDESLGGQERAAISQNRDLWTMSFTVLTMLSSRINAEDNPKHKE